MHNNRKSHTIFQSEEKATQEMENQLSATTVVSWMAHRITANAKVQSVSSVTKQVIYSLNLLKGNPLQSQRKRHMSVSQTILRN